MLDGFTIEFLPETDHTQPGHVHTINAMGAAPVIANNILRYNGSTTIGGHATFVHFHSSTAYKHGDVDDYRAEAIQFRPAVLAMHNVVYCNNGVGIGANHYSCMEVYDNEVFWSHMPRDYNKSPGIGSKHGSKTRIERNIVYDNAWVGIGCRQGKLEGEPGKHVNERTLSVVRDNLVWDNGWPEAPEENQANIGVDGCGLPDIPVLVEGNAVSGAGGAGIGIRNEFSGSDYAGTSTYVTVVNNEIYQNTASGIGCNGNEIGPAECEIQDNVVHDNGTAGIAVPVSPIPTAPTTPTTSCRGTTASRTTAAILPRPGAQTRRPPAAVCWKAASSEIRGSATLTPLIIGSCPTHWPSTPALTWACSPSSARGRTSAGSSASDSRPREVAKARRRFGFTHGTGAGMPGVWVRPWVTMCVDPGWGGRWRG